MRIIAHAQIAGDEDMLTAKFAETQVRSMLLPWVAIPATKCVCTSRFGPAGRGHSGVISDERIRCFAANGICRECHCLYS